MMKTCHNIICQTAVSIAYLQKEIDEEGLANHPCRDIVVSMKNKTHLQIGTMGNELTRLDARGIGMTCGKLSLPLPMTNARKSFNSCTMSIMLVWD
jgi:hypothetical protein